MATITRLSDIVSPELFINAIGINATEKIDLVQSGIFARSEAIENLLRGQGGNLLNIDRWDDLGNTMERTSTDTIPQQYTGGTKDPDPNSIKMIREQAIRLSRNNSWGYSRLAALLASSDPSDRIMEMLSNYWARRAKALALSTIKGIFAHNAGAAVGGDHVQNDMIKDISSGAYKAGGTDISANAAIDAIATMGDMANELTTMVMHSVVYTKLQKQNLIATIPNSDGRINFPTYLNRRIIVDDSVTNSNNVYDTYFFGEGAFSFGLIANPGDGIVVERLEGAGNGGGADVIYSRVQMCIHPTGYTYKGDTSLGGGPNNATLETAGSWLRVFHERKQILMAALRTKEA